MFLALGHGSRLAGVDGEAFFEGDSHDLDLKAGALAGKVLVTGKEEIVGVAGVGRSGFFGQARETAVETEGGEVGQGGGSGCALGKVRTTVEGALGGGEVWARTAGSGEGGKGEGDGLAVAEGHEGALDTGATEGGEEVGEVHFQDHRFVSMRFGEVDDAAASAESGGGFVRRDAVEETAQEELLSLFEERLGRL